MSSDVDSIPPEYVDALRLIEAAKEDYAVQQALTAAREQLSMDAAYLTSIGSGQQVFDAVVGDIGALGLAPGFAVAVEETYCMRMLNGEIPNVVPDTRREPALRGLWATSIVGSYIGVPVKLSDGRVHGSLCCASSECRAELGSKELKFMQVLAGIVATRVEQAKGEMAGKAERLRGQHSND